MRVIQMKPEQIRLMPPHDRTIAMQLVSSHKALRGDRFIPVVLKYMK